MSGSALKRPRVRRSVKRFADLLDTAAKRLLLSVSLSFSLASASRFERFCRRVAQLVERCLDTAEVWGSSPHAPTILIELFRYFCPPFIVHGTVWQTFGRLSKI